MNPEKEKVFDLLNAMMNGEDLLNINEIIKDQEIVLQLYRDQGAFLSKNDEGVLHQFFSPTRIPRGLTNEEVRVCILLCPLRQFEMNAGLGEDLIFSRAKDLDSLVDNFRKIREMTRDAFRVGISAWLKWIHEAHRPQPPLKAFTTEELALLKSFLAKYDISILADFFGDVS